MKFITLIGEVIPKYCNVHPSMGKVSLVVHDAEIEGAVEFSALAFENTRDRAKVYLPYAREEIKEHKEALDLVEYAICNHEIKDHGEDYGERIGQLSESLGPVPDILEGETLEAGTRGWWNA